MFASLSARIVGIGLIVVAALAFLAGLLADASSQTSKSFGGVTHSAEVIETAEMALGDLRDAESGQRGFILTRNPAYARTFSEQVAGSAKSIDWVVHLTQDNPLQHARARELASLMAQRSDALRQPLKLGQMGDFAGATAIIAGGQGRNLMDALAVRAQALLEEERRLQTDQSLAAEQRLASGKRQALIGAPIVAMLVLVGFGFLIRGIRRPPVTIIQAMSELGSGARSARIETAMGSKEFGHLAQGYNAMVADREESEERLQVANVELQRTVRRCASAGT